MSNQITYRRGGVEPLVMSNGLTSVVLDLLALSGRALAHTTWQHEAVEWLAAHDQERSGLGAVGFDLDELAWSGGSVSSQKRFLLDVIEDARSGARWNRLDYQPHAEWARAALDRLAALVDAVQPPDDASSGPRPGSVTP